jgi:integrin beta 3
VIPRTGGTGTPPGPLGAPPPGPVGTAPAPVRAAAAVAAPGAPAAARAAPAPVRPTSGPVHPAGATAAPPRPTAVPATVRTAAPVSPVGPAGLPGPAGPAPGAGARIQGARSELRRQLREGKRVRTTALAMIIALLLGSPVLYFLIQTATRDPVLNSLAALDVPDWAQVSADDKIIGGSRWCFIDCRFRERIVVSTGDEATTTQVYQEALREDGWVPWVVDGCPQGPVLGDYTCWTRDEYTLDLWVHLPACAYDPRRLRPTLEPEAEGEAPAAGAEATPGGAGGAECSGSIVEIKMQNRVADERGRPGRDGGPGPGQPTPTGQQPTGEPTAGATP